MRVCGPLYNVNEITVDEGLQRDYIRFQRRLNSYLKRKYGPYYIGLQLYQNKVNSRDFFVIAYYRNIPGVERVAVIAGTEISSIYDRVWGNTVQRTSIFSFLNFRRVIPVQFIR